MRSRNFSVGVFSATSVGSAIRSLHLKPEGARVKVRRFRVVVQFQSERYHYANRFRVVRCVGVLSRRGLLLSCRAKPRHPLTPAGGGFLHCAPLRSEGPSLAWDSFNQTVPLPFPLSPSSDACAYHRHARYAGDRVHCAGAAEISVELCERRDRDPRPSGLASSARCSRGCSFSPVLGVLSDRFGRRP